MTRRYYVNNAPQQTLASSITNSATSCTVASSFSGWPTSFPFYATLDFGQLSEEIVLVTNIVGTTATITRGQDGSAAVSHAAGATIDFTVVAKDYDEANAHVNANSGVHGVSGSVVGTSDAQTLTNKTLTTPTVSGATVSGTWTGTISASGLTLNSPTINNGIHQGDSTHPAVTAQAGASGTRIASYKNSSGTEKAYFDQNGNLAAPQVAGVCVPTTYTNEAAASAALGTPPIGALVYLTAPTTNYAAPGLFEWVGSWKALAPDDTGWQAITVNAGFAALSGNGPMMRRIGNKVKFKGGFSNTGMAANNTYASVGQLPTLTPSAFIPAVDFWPCASSSGEATAAVVVNTNGALDIRTGATLGAYYQLNAVDYYLD